MRMHLLITAIIGGTILVTSSAYAASNADYQAARAAVEVTTTSVTTDLAPLAGKNLELDGVVSGIFARRDAPGFLFQLNEKQTLPVSLRATDPDVVIGAKLRVLAHVASTGKELEALSLTPTPKTGTSAMQASSPGTPQTAASTPAQKQASSSPGAKRRNVSSRTTVKKATSVSSRSRSTGTVRNAEWYAGRITAYSGKISRATALSIARNVLAKSAKHRVDPLLVFALLAQESHFNPKAVSPVGAKGLGQLMPGTAAEMGVKNPFDIAQNIDGSVRYLAQQLRRFGGDKRRALAAYNAGPGNVIRYGGVPPFRETRNYVQVINTHYTHLTGGRL